MGKHTKALVPVVDVLLVETYCFSKYFDLVNFRQRRALKTSLNPLNSLKISIHPFSQCLSRKREGDRHLEKYIARANPVTEQKPEGKKNVISYGQSEHLPLLATDTAHNKAKLCIMTCGFVYQADKERYWEMPRRNCDHARWRIALSRQIIDKVEDQAVAVLRGCRQLCLISASARNTRVTEQMLCRCHFQYIFTYP